MATALTECPLGTPKRKQIVAGQMLPAVEVGSHSYRNATGAFNTLYHGLTALEHSAHSRSEWPLHSPNARSLGARNVEEQETDCG
jgi:hypothetical protein